MAEDDEERLHSSLDRLKSSLSKARQTQQVSAPLRSQASDSAGSDSGMSLGMRAGSEFVSAVVIGAALGWGVDRLLGTHPAS